MLKEVLTISAHAPRILFLTKKQRTSVLCVILALLLVASATGCSFAELTRQKSGEITLPEENAPVTAEPADTPAPADTLIGQEEPADMPVEPEAPVQEPPQLVNDGSYDTSQPLQDWELARTNGVQTGMTQAQVEAITGPLTENENGTYDVKISHTDDFYGMISGLDTVYYETGEKVYANIPVGYTRGENDVQVTMYSGGEMLTSFAVDEENCLVWAES